MSIRTSARIGAYACLGIALAMAGLALRVALEPSAIDLPPTEKAAPADPLQVRLLRCQQAGEAAGSDRDCLAAWSESRRRFLGLGRARPAEPTPPSPEPINAAAGIADAPAAALPQEH